MNRQMPSGLNSGHSQVGRIPRHVQGPVHSLQQTPVTAFLCLVCTATSAALKLRWWVMLLEFCIFCCMPLDGIPAMRLSNRLDALPCLALPCLALPCLALPCLAWHDALLIPQSDGHYGSIYLAALSVLLCSITITTHHALSCRRSVSTTHVSACWFIQRPCCSLLAFLHAYAWQVQPFDKAKHAPMTSARTKPPEVAPQR